MRRARFRLRFRRLRAAGTRQTLWTKGETSGNFLNLVSMDIDCDNDTILARVNQVGAACHTGNRTCFYTELKDFVPEKDNKEE